MFLHYFSDKLSMKVLVSQPDAMMFVTALIVLSIPQVGSTTLAALVHSILTALFLYNKLVIHHGSANCNFMGSYRLLMTFHQQKLFRSYGLIGVRLIVNLVILSCAIEHCFGQLTISVSWLSNLWYSGYWRGTTPSYGIDSKLFSPILLKPMRITIGSRPGHHRRQYSVVLCL